MIVRSQSVQSIDADELAMLSGARPAPICTADEPRTRQSPRTGRRAATVRLTRAAIAKRSPVALDGQTAIPYEALSNETLSYRAIGILIYLLSLDHGDPTTVRDLAHGTVEGIDAVNRALAELAAAGWVEPLYVKARVPAELRMAVLRRDGFRCVECDADSDLMADHLIPESKGGPTTFENLQTLCRSCNSRKGASL